MRIFTTAIFAASFYASSAIGESNLHPGKPAGIHQAMSVSEKRELYVFGAVGIAAAGGAIVLIGNHKNTAAPTSTSP